VRREGDAEVEEAVLPDAGVGVNFPGFVTLRGILVLSMVCSKSFSFGEEIEE
jgi:hypothetical protein